MMRFSRWQRIPALVLAFGITSGTIVPFTKAAAVANPAPQTVAQLFPSAERRVAIPVGTRLPLRYDQTEKLVVGSNQPVTATLVVPQNIRARSGDLLIPAWSEVKGQFKPVNGGSQFFAEELILTDGTKLAINGTSDVIAVSQEERRGGDTGDVLKGAAIGAAGGTVLSKVTGRKKITIGKVLLGAGAGALGGLLLGKKTVDVVTINPNTNLSLTLNSALALR